MFNAKVAEKFKVRVQ